MADTKEAATLEPELQDTTVPVEEVKDPVDDPKGSEPSSDFVSQWDQALSDLREAAAAARSNPTRANEADVKSKEDEAAERLEKLIAAENLDDDPSTALREIARQHLESAKRFTESEKRYRQLIESQNQRIESLSESMYRSQFEARHPELAGQYEKLVKEASNDPDVIRAYGVARNSNDPSAHDLFKMYFANKWNHVVQKAAESKKGGEVKSPKNGSVGKTKSADGTKLIGSRAGQAQASDSGGKSLYERLWPKLALK